jgi:predicted nucleotidyltransferase
MLEKPPIEYITRTIVERMNPRRIVIFGSYASGTPGPDSDIDLMIEMETTLRKPYREMAVDELFGLRGWAMDIFVYTPEEVREKKDRVGHLLYTIEREGKVVYERRD